MSKSNGRLVWAYGRDALRATWSQRPTGRQCGIFFLLAWAVLALGYALLYGVYHLPLQPLQEKVFRAYTEGYFAENHPRRSPDMVTGKRYDMWTECTGIGAALHNPQNIEELFVIRYYGECSGLSAAAEKHFSTPPPYQYMRYTHGYLLMLRPLYTFFDIQHVRLFTIALFAISMFFLLYALNRHTSAVASSIVVGAFFLPCSPSMYVMTTHSAQFLLVVLAAISIIHIHEPKKVMLFMGIVGVADSFVTFLSMGSLSLSLPLLCYALAAWKRDEPDPHILAVLFWSSVAWSVGFLLPWLCKWGVLSVFWNMGVEDIFSNKIEEYSPRSLSMIWVAVRNNVTTTHWEAWVPIFLLLLVRRIKYGMRMPSGLWVILFPALIPFVWIALLPGQSGVKHSTFINLILWPTLAAIALVLVAPDKKATLRTLIWPTASPSNTKTASPSSTKMHSRL